MYANKTVEAIMEFGKEATGNENYEIGAITKGAAQAAKDGIQQYGRDVVEKGAAGITEFGKEVTGDDKYDVGAKTKSMARSWFAGAAAAVREFNKELAGGDDGQTANATVASGPATSDNGNTDGME